MKRAREKIAMRRELKQYTLHLEDMVAEKAEQLVRAERLAAVGQVVEGFSSALRNIVDDMDGEITFLNEMPCLISIHNRDLRILAANHLFTFQAGQQDRGRQLGGLPGPVGQSQPLPGGQNL